MCSDASAAGTTMPEYTVLTIVGILFGSLLSGRY